MYKNIEREPEVASLHDSYFKDAEFKETVELFLNKGSLELASSTKLFKSNKKGENIRIGIESGKLGYRLSDSEDFKYSKFCEFSSFNEDILKGFNVSDESIEFVKRFLDSEESKEDNKPTKLNNVKDRYVIYVKVSAIEAGDEIVLDQYYLTSEYNLVESTYSAKYYLEDEAINMVDDLNNRVSQFITMFSRNRSYQYNFWRGTTKRKMIESVFYTIPQKSDLYNILYTYLVYNCVSIMRIPPHSQDMVKIEFDIEQI